jgi:hypothetical protein
MNTIDIKRFGFAFGITGAILYLGCIIVMSTVEREGTIAFFNTLLHGLDSAPIIRMDVPWWEAGLGIIQTFIIAWLIGACIAVFYNLSLRKKK